jgi:YesN/AraC family two-component response regulator
MKEICSVYNILIVDDEKDLRNIIEDYLSSELNSTIYKADSGKTALEILNKKRIDIGIIDLKMPVMNGLELLKEINVKWPEMVCLILTGYAERNDFLKAIEYQVYDFLEKPCKQEFLVNRVKRALRYKYHKALLDMAIKEFLSSRFDSFNIAEFERKSLEEKNKIIEVGLSLLSMKNFRNVVNE